MPRGIPNRAEAVQGERRRRSDDTLNRVTGLKLALPAEFRDDPNYEYRWINDENSRVQDLTVADDWEICRTEGVEAGQSDTVRRVVGTKANGSQLDAYLVRKPKAFVEEDRKRKTAVAAREEKALLAGPQDSSDGAYVDPGSSIRRRGGFAP